VFDLANISITPSQQIRGRLCFSQERQKREDDLGEERIEYERLCRGELSLSPLQQSRLKCRYSTGKNLYLLIGKEIFTEVHTLFLFL
jgi:hypothetical protein